MTDRELMQQALEALEIESKGYADKVTRNRRVITALRERLAQPVQPQWHMAGFSTPPRREWVGLTLEEIFDCTAHITRIQKDDWVATDSDLAEFAHVIEAKLKEKNA